MSDEEVQTKAPSKRGRKPNPEKTAAKKEEKAVKNDSDGDAPPVKKGRGRPKGTGKKSSTSKTNGTTKGKRGRSKKVEKKEDSSAEEEENGKSSANEEDEEDDD